MTKEIDQNAHFAAFAVDVIHRSVEILERSIHNLNRIALAEIDFERGRFGFHALQDALDFFLCKRRGAVAHANKAAHIGCIAHD